MMNDYMNVRHNLPDHLLMGYAAGALPEAFNLVVATHVSLSDDSRARLAAFEAVGGAVIDRATPVDIDESSVDLMIDRIISMPQANARAPRMSAGIFPAPLADYLGHDERAVNWRPVASGVKQSILHADRQGSVRLLKIPAGAEMPDHGHHGVELTLVLQGAFIDGNRRYGRGDIAVADEATEHTPVATSDEVCICLAATDAPLRMKGLLPRLAQPFFRI
jgi:putative transcriptional regulator